MTKIEALELELAARKMVEGTELDWEVAVRFKTTKNNISRELSHYIVKDIELAIGVIEGRPVWEGDKYYNTSSSKIIARGGSPQDYWDKCSWHPPKPKTIMVELIIEDAEMFESDRCKYSMLDKRVFSAIRKALEELK